MTHIHRPIQMKSVQRGLISVVNLKVMFPGTRSAGWIRESQKSVFLMPTQFRISGAMVARYTRALSGELAVEEFQRSWRQT